MSNKINWLDSLKRGDLVFYTWSPSVGLEQWSKRRVLRTTKTLIFLNHVLPEGLRFKKQDSACNILPINQENTARYKKAKQEVSRLSLARNLSCETRFELLTADQLERITAIVKE